VFVFGPRPRAPSTAMRGVCSFTKWGGEPLSMCVGSALACLHFGVDRLNLFAAAGRPWSVTTAHGLAAFCQLLAVLSCPTVSHPLQDGAGCRRGE